MARFQGGTSKHSSWYRYVCVVENVTKNGLQVMGCIPSVKINVILSPKKETSN
jgi:hypothetical protein